MHYHYPIEQMAASRRSRFQRGFAAMALHLLPELDGVVCEATSQGLRMLADDEGSLATPLDILRQAYGEELRLSGPRVRMVRDEDGLKEPVMGLRVSIPRTFAEAMLADAARREVVALDVELQPERLVMRGEAPLRRLLGYRQALAGFGASTAEVGIWLNRYERVPDPPGGDAA